MKWNNKYFALFCATHYIHKNIVPPMEVVKVAVIILRIYLIFVFVNVLCACGTSYHAWLYFICIALAWLVRAAVFTDFLVFAPTE